MGKRKSKTASNPYDHGKSICLCGHTGDGPGSQHANTLAEGHGPCMVNKCTCLKFTWARWRDDK